MGNQTVAFARFLIFIFPLFSFALEPDFSYKVHLSTERLSLTDNLQVELTLTFPSNYHVDVAELREHLLQYGAPGISPFKLIAEQIEAPNEGRRGQKIIFTLEPQFPGTFQLTFLNIPFEGDPKTELLSDLYSVHVTMPEALPEPIPAPLLKLSPDPSIDISSGNRRNLKFDPSLVKKEEEHNRAIRAQRSISWFGLLALLAALALLLTSKQKPKPAPKPPQINPRQEALSKLKTLENQDLDADHLYTGLTSAVRVYLESKFPIKATTLTTEEFFQELTKKRVLDSETNQALISFLQSADIVKFGRYSPSIEERKAAFAAARKIFEIE